MESTYFLPFIPQANRKNTGNFDNKTISLNATHPSIKTTEYNVHSLYGHMMSMRTHEFMTKDATYPKKGERPFILTRSTFASTGKYASHWLGDNFRKWSYLKYSVSGIMSMNMFGIPHTGADVCGFYGEDIEDEMCARWIQLATFYPLARFHYANSSESNEPFLLRGSWKRMA